MSGLTNMNQGDLNSSCSMTLILFAKAKVFLPFPLVFGKQLFISGKCYPTMC